MNTTRLPKLVIAVCLILAAFFAYQAFYQNPASVSANSGTSQSVGFGDLRRVEGQQSLIPTGASQTIGFGDLRRVEAQQSLAASSSAQRVGFGDLQRYEGQQSLTTTNSASRRVGFGDLRRFEAQQQDLEAAHNSAP
jgi:hypothetical protein